MTMGRGDVSVRGLEACGKVFCEFHDGGGLVEEGYGTLLQPGVDEAGV